jgi:hypothetical protein
VLSLLRNLLTVVKVPSTYKFEILKHTTAGISMDATVIAFTWPPLAYKQKMLIHKRTPATPNSV